MFNKKNTFLIVALVIGAVYSVGAVVHAQTNCTPVGACIVLPSATGSIYWTHANGADGVPVVSFKYKMDSAAAVDVGIPSTRTVDGALTTFSIPFPPATTAGNHVLILQACNASGCGDSAPVTVNVVRTDVVVKPSTPTGVVIIRQ